MQHGSACSAASSRKMLRRIKRTRSLRRSCSRCSERRALPHFQQPTRASHYQPYRAMEALLPQSMARSRCNIACTTFSHHEAALHLNSLRPFRPLCYVFSTFRNKIEATSILHTPPPRARLLGFIWRTRRVRRNLDLNLMSFNWPSQKTKQHFLKRITLGGTAAPP